MTAGRTLARLSIGPLLVFAACSRSSRAPETPEQLEQAVAADPNDDRSWYELASARRRSGDCDRALVAYRRYTQLVPAQNDPYYGLGLCQEKIGDRAGALASLRRYVANAKDGQVKYVDHAKQTIAKLEASGSDAAATVDAEPLLTRQTLPPELKKLVDAAHAHPAVASLEAAGCDLALVMVGADYNRFVDLRHKKKMPAQVDDPRGHVVYCQRRTPTPPACAELAPIFARVAHPKRQFEVFSGYVDPPFTPRCAGLHDAKGKFVSGEGPGYVSSR